jgi:hypothetical protein
MAYNKEQSEFDSTILWDAAHNLAKLEFKTSPKGEQYFFGELNKTNKITMRPDKFNEGKWILQIVPVKFTKKQAGGFQQASFPGKSTYQQPAVAQPVAPSVPDDEKAPWEQ